ncbi:MAG: Mov34/MPN/PAD-1 family protein [Candidatus Hodarchaeales archaeon]|jgi:proteasome lid subunit RPN8/RPN11
MYLEIPQKELDKIRKHGKEKYPHECCGILIGYSSSESPIQVIEARKVRNINEGNPNRRYEINPLDLLKLEDETDEKGLQIVGIYHSHPNHPAQPSQYDLERAWPNFSYLILSVLNGLSDKITSWRLNKSRDEFLEEEIQISFNQTH